MKLERQSLHNDYFRDDKERICQVLSWLQPVNEKICIIKYILGKGYWRSQETGLQYERILKSYSLSGQQDNLLQVIKDEPSYFFHSAVYDADFLAVPLTRMKEYYYPEKRLNEIVYDKPTKKLDALELKVKVLAELLKDFLNIPISNIGVTGSILWKGQTKKSDIDIIIYGNNYAQSFSEKFQTLYDTHSKIKPLSENKKKRYELSLARKSGLPRDLIKKYIAKKKWLSTFGKTEISIIFNPLPNETPFQYGQQIFKPIRRVDIEGTIANTTLGNAYPSIYELTDCKPVGDKSLYTNLPLTRILSFEGALTGYFKKGDRIIARGLLEEVIDVKNDKQFFQIILGTKECIGNEFILLKEDFLNYFKK